jgi:hypothetical protein
MHRVELVVYLDRALCKQFDAYDVIERIERGEFPDVSMGCRVPYDTCTVCEHKSKTRADYCEHAATMMNKILPDGRKVAVRNDTPKFFDISFVFIGADKTAKVMAKLASKGNQVCMGDFCTIPRASAEVGEMFSKAANDPIKVKYDVAGVPVHIEWKKGETRLYKKGKVVKYKRFMKADYGYIPETKDSDGEEIDVYVGPDHRATNAWVIKQLKKSDGSFDENKVMMGYGSEQEAHDAYDYHMGGTKEFFGGIHKVPVSALRALFSENGDGHEKEKKASACSCAGLCNPCGGGLDKIAAAIFPVSEEKSASHQKLSELIKSIPAGPFTKETLPRLEEAERDIPKDVLDLMGGLPLRSALSTPAMLGMILKPREFQRVVLVSMGDKPFADELDQKNMTFSPTEELDESLPIGEDHVNGHLKELLSVLGLVRDRSAAQPVLHQRTTIIICGPAKAEKQKSVTSDEPVMKKLAAVYNGYRRSLLKKAASIQQFLTTDPQLSADLFGGSMAEAFAGGIGKVATAGVLGPDSLAYLVGAYTDRDFHVSSKEVVASLALTGAVTEAA